MSVLLTATGLVKHYRTGGGIVTAVDGVDLSVRAGETLALVGESGSGKTTLAKLLLRLVEPDAGRIEFEGRDLLALRGRALDRIRPRIQMVFQDPLAALNPRARVGRLLEDPLRIHAVVPARGRAEAVARLLGKVGLGPHLAARYPHELSGGQRQRVNIARALATGPRLLVLDEPVSALDVSVRAQILNLLGDLQAADGIAYLLITHDLGVVRAVADRVAVMFGGRIVETGPSESVWRQPAHPYTRALVAAVPRPGKAPEPPVEPASLPGWRGCRYRPFCPAAVEACRTEPALAPHADGRAVACHRPALPPRGPSPEEGG